MYQALSIGRRLRCAACVSATALTVGAAALIGLPSIGGSGVLSATEATAATAAIQSKGPCASGTAPGISSNQVNVAATIIDVNSGSLSNASVGVPSPQLQETYYNEVAKKLNSEGGAGCRKIVMSFYPVDAVSAANAQQACLSIANAQPFIVLDSGSLTEVGASDCIPQHHILLSSSYLTTQDLSTDHPYALDIGEIPEDGFQTGVAALKTLGDFSSAKGFKKLGVLYHTCTQGDVNTEKAALASAKVPSNDIVYFNLRCPAGQQDTSASMEQAVLSFKSAGVTDVTEVDVTDYGLFSQVAAQQDYTPHYLFTDSAAPASNFSGPEAPDPTNFNGTVDIVEGGFGEATTPGFTPSGATKSCNAIYTSDGQLPLYKQLDGYGGIVCGYLFFVQSLLNHASTVSPAAQISSLHKIGLLDLPYPFAPINFSAAPAGSPTGVTEWRALYYHASCKCWEIPDPTFNKSTA